MCAAVAASLVVLLTAGCGGDAVTDGRTTDVVYDGRATADEIRLALASKHVFVSEEEFRQYFVLTSVPGQAVYAHLYVYFTWDKVEWVFQEDLAERADYRVDEEGNIEATGAWAGRVEGKYDADAGRLLWEGNWYVHR